MDALKKCFNPKVLVGLAATGIALLILAPGLVLGALPVLLALACPLSMLAMMWGMQKMGGQARRDTASPEAPTLAIRREQQLANLQGQLENLRAQHEALTRQIAALEPTGPPIPEPATPACPGLAIAPAVQLGNPDRSRPPHRPTSWGRAARRL